MKPHARLLTTHGQAFWVVFNPPYAGRGYIGPSGDFSLEGAYKRWDASK